MKKICILWLGLALLASLPSLAEKKKELVLGATQEFETLNPMVMQMVATHYISHMVRRELTLIDADWKWIPLLATKIPTFENGLVQKVTEGGKEKLLVQWEIRPNVRWGDGTALTGHDVKFSWEVGNAPEVAVPEREQYSKIEAMTVDPKEPRRFTMKFKEPRYDYFHLGTFYIIPKHLEEPIFKKTRGQTGAYEKLSLYQTNPTNPGLYFGPYLIKEVKLGSHLILVPNPYFYGAKPKIDQIVFKLIPNNQVLEANLRSGAINMIYEGTDFTLDQALSLEKRIKPSDPFVLIYRAGDIFEHIDLNLRDGILKDVRVRQALLQSINKEQLLQALFEGKYRQALHRIHPLDPYYTEAVPKYPYDPKKAASLLEEASWKLGADGYRYKDGVKLSLFLQTTAGNKTRELVEVFLQDQWKKVGIEIKIKNEPARVFFGETVGKGKYPHLAMFAWVSSPDNPFESGLHSKNIPSAANGFSGQNTGGYSNPEVDRLFGGIYRQFDLNQRKETMKKLLSLELNDLPTLPLYYRSDIVVLPKGMKNFRITGHQFYSAARVEYWDLP